MKKYLIVIAKYKDERQDFFEQIISPCNKNYCLKHDFEYIEIKNDYPLSLVRDNPTWWKFTIIQDLIKNKTFKENDIITHLDADMCIADDTKAYETSKSFSYSIDSGNTHCMGSYSLKVNDWSQQLLENILSEERYKKLNNLLSVHERFGYVNCFWHEFREQASWYSLAGIKRHSDEPFWNLPNNGWHSDKTEWTIYSLDELYKNVEILPTAWNVTEMEGESSCEFLINKVDKKDVIIRHFAGGQKWRKDWFKI
jgi:hypothetical protein